MAGFSIDPSLLPKFMPSAEAAPDDKSKPSALRAGLGAGIHQLLGLGGSALQGVGTLTDAAPVAEAGKDFAATQNRIAERVGRPDLDVAPWQQGGAGVAPWLTYQAAKLVPTLAGYTAATVLTPEAAIPTGLARLGAAAPEFLGGGALEAGAGFGARRAALETGQKLGKFVVGGGAFGGTTGFGQAIASADQKPGGVTASDAWQAAAESPLYAAAGLVGPGFLRGALKGAEGKLVTRVLGHGLAGSVVGGVQAGVLAGLDQTFRPDLSTSDKMSNIVDATLTGGAVGGAIGAATGVRGLKRTNPTAIDTDTLSSVIDQELNLGDASQAQNLGRVALPAPTMFADSAGRTVFGSGGDAELRATPRDPAAPIEIPQADPALPSPGDIEGRSAVPGSTIVVGRRGERGQFTSEATGVEQPPVVPDDTSRAFRNFTDNELSAASNALANKREAQGKLSTSQEQVASGIDAELAFRRQADERNGALTNPVVSSAAEAVDRSANRKGAGTQDSADPASPSNDNIASHVTELTQGLRLPTTLKEKLANARSTDEVNSIIHDEVIVEGKGGKMRDQLAQRAGLLDGEGRPTPMVDEISARKTEPGEQAPTPAADAMFALKWKDDVKAAGQKDPAVRALNPTSEADAKLQIYRALGDQGVKSDKDGLEHIAQKYGVLDDNKQLTPEALDLAKRDPIPADDAKKVAAAQGFKGAELSHFDQGVRAATGEAAPITKFDSTRQGEAYQAGVKFAEETNSVPKGALKKYAPGPQLVGKVTDADVARIDGTAKPPQARVVPEEVKPGQTLNRAVDATRDAFGTRDDDVAQLKSMVRSGDVEGAMEGLQRVQRGERLFQQPERQPTGPFKGEKVIPGAPKAARTADLVPTKGTSRAEAERAIRHYELGQRIDAAHAEGSIDSRSRLSLVAKLRQGKVGDVIKAVGAPTGRIEGPIGERVNRAERRAELHRQLQEALAEHARDAEVPELNVDENGVIQGHRYRTDADGNAVSSAVDRKSASMLLSQVIDGATPKDIMRELATRRYAWPWLGKMAADFAKYVPDDVRFEAVTTQEMNKVLAGFNMKPDEPGGSLTQGLWSNSNRTIYLSTAVFHPSVFMHEIAHAIIADHIDNKTAIGKKMIATFERLKPDLPKGDYAATNANEFMAEFLSRQQVRDYVRDISAQHPGNIFKRLWDAIRTALGKPPQSEVEKLLNLAEAAGGSRLGPDTIASSPLLMRSPQLNEHTKDVVKDAISTVEGRIEKIDPVSKLRKFTLYWGGENTLAAKFGKMFETADGNGLHDKVRADDQRSGFATMFAKPTNAVYDQFRGVKRTDRKSYDALNQLIQLTANGIHPGRSWEDQSEFVKANPANKPAHAEAYKIFRSLQSKDASTKTTDRVGAYNAMMAHENMSMMRQFANQLHRIVTSNVLSADRIPGFEQHPADVLMDRSTRETFDVDQTKQFWQDTATNQLKAVDRFIAEQRAIADHPATSDADKKIIVGNVADLEKLSQQVKTGFSKLAAGPNFHLGRTGDYFVDMKLRTDAEGAVDKAALKATAEHLKDFGVVVPLNADASHIFMRVESQAAQDRLYSKAEELRKLSVVTSDEGSIQAGKRGDARIAKIADPFLAKYEANISANTRIDDETKAYLIKEARSTALDMLSDNALAKFLAPRDFVPGFDNEMVDSFLTRAKAANDTMVGQVIAPKIGAAYTSMERAVQAAQKADRGAVPLEQRSAMKDVIKEMRTRDQARLDYSQTPLVDGMRRIANFWALGGTIAYPIVQMTQLPMVAMPKLGSKHGFLKAARAIGQVTPQALRIMRAVFDTATDNKNLSRAQQLARAANVEISLEALRKAGVSPKIGEYLMHLTNAGQLGTGSQAHILSGSAKGTTEGVLNHTMQYASGMGYYAETLSRVITALAHAKLNPDLAANDLAAGGIQLLKDSMFDFHMDAQGRALGKSGIFGTKTPLMTQFMTYQSQLVQRLYLEMHGAFTKGQTPERQREARMFLLQHAAMVTAVAGTTGLPFASAFAAAYNKIKELVDPSDGLSDVMASYRGFLSDMFGKDGGELIAKGGFRALGVDMTNRVGEQDVLPFSRFLGDRRAFKDQVKDLESRSWGAPANMVANAVEGGGRLADGDVLGGITAMLPAAINNPVKAYRMTSQGYTDAAGNKLPIATPETDAVMAQLMGFTPSPKAEYQEANVTQQTRHGLLQRQGAQLRSQIVSALSPGGDRSAARDLISQALEFDRANPQIGVMQGVEGAIQRKTQAQVISQRFSTPLGVSPKDFKALPLTKYANVSYRAQ